MDSPHAIGFYVSAGLSLAGGLVSAFLTDRARRALALGVAAIGIAGIYLALSAGFAALVALACYGGCALLLSRPELRVQDVGVASGWRQVGAVLAAVLLAGLAYAAYRGDFAQSVFNGGLFGSAAVGRLLFARDALATEAVGALVLVALVGATAAWRVRGRGR
jgi:NADH:ubiquinone oxidoreductase subunit 6 (subunit J)